MRSIQKYIETTRMSEMAVGQYKKKNSIGKRKERKGLEGLGINGMIILKRILKNAL